VCPSFVCVVCTMMHQPEPETLVGMVISVRWPSGNWYDCVVKAYDATTDKHFVHFADDDRMWYNMAAKTCVLPQGWWVLLFLLSSMVVVLLLLRFCVSLCFFVWLVGWFYWQHVTPDD